MVLLCFSSLFCKAVFGLCTATKCFCQFVFPRFTFARHFVLSSSIISPMIFDTTYLADSSQICGFLRLSLIFIKFLILRTKSVLQYFRHTIFNINLLIRPAFFIFQRHVIKRFLPSCPHDVRKIIQTRWKEIFSLINFIFIQFSRPISLLFRYVFDIWCVSTFSIDRTTYCCVLTHLLKGKWSFDAYFEAFHGLSSCGGAH